MTKSTLSITVVVCAALYASACVHPAPPAVATVPAPAHEPASTPPGPVTQQAAVIPEAKPAAPSVSYDSIHIDSTVIVRRAMDVFGDAPAVPVAAPADATAAGPSWDIEVHSYESTSRVERYVRLFSTTAKDRIAVRLERGTKYEPMIRAKMKAGGLPEDMYYLALIESGFDPNAYSRAAAVGMWQFMSSTGRDMGLRVDWWVDERRDPFKSTDAAVRFIKGLRDQFGSLYLAAAAYNGGPGRIARGLTRYADDLEGTSGDDLFFALAEKDYLRNETREYVPQLIAAALIAKEPAKYGMTLTPQPPVMYDSVRVGPSTALAAIAKASGATTDALRDLNPQILRGVTPPKDSFFVRVPSGRADSTMAALAEMPKSARVGLLMAESKKGESMASIAKKNGVTARQLALYNPKVKQLKSGNLAPGQLLYVPTMLAASAAVAVPDPDIERYGSSSKSATMHVVKSGETLSGIAKKYGTTSDALMRANGLKRALIFPGQSLVVKGSAPKRASTAKAQASASKAKASATAAKSRIASKSSTGSKKKASKRG